MTYKFNPTQHSTKIKAGLLKAKQASKKLGRPKGEKIKGEDEVIRLKRSSIIDLKRTGDFKYSIINNRITYDNIAKLVRISKSTVQKIINKYKKNEYKYSRKNKVSS